ncbi:MAG: AsmA-like C-terminal domain-containing protein [Alphaproteobacteria bacterium]|nr:AsmA-like C-terminal domain-containing protein [Alphaproteobacteria bacterium]
MTARILTLALEIIGVLVAGMVIAVIALGWRLTSGPISLDFAQGLVQDALAPRDLPIEVEIGEPVLTWKGWARVFDVTVKDVRVTGYGGALDARAPSVQIRLSVPALVKGIAAPVRITVNQPNIQLGDALMSGGTKTVDDAKWFAEILNGIASATDGPDRLSYLRLVELNDATIENLIPSGGGTIILKDLNAALHRHSRVLRINATATVIIDDAATKVGLDVNYDDARQRISGSAKLNGLPFSTAARALSLDETVVSWSAPLDTELSFEFQPTWTLQSASGSLGSQNGNLGLPALFSKPHHFDALGLEFAYEATADQLDITSLTLREGEVNASVGMKVSDLAKAPTISLRASTKGFPGDRLRHYWPPTLGIDARNWVLGNLEGGTVPKASVEVDVKIDPSNPEPITIMHLAGGIDFQNVTGYYFRPLPPVTEISGRATFNLTQFDITIDSGRRDVLKLEESRVKFVNLDTNQEKAEIDAVVRGPLQAGLDIINHEALDLGRHIKLDTKSVSGLADARLRFAFPLINSLTLDQVDFAASADLEGVGVADIAAGQALSDATLKLELNRDSLRIDGRGMVAGTQATLTMEEVFTKDARIRTRKHLNGVFDEAVLKDLGLPSFAVLEGPVTVDVKAHELADGRSELMAVVDLKDARLALPALKWAKPAKAAGRVRFSLEMLDGRIRRLKSASLVAADLGLDMTATFAADTGALENARFDRLVLAKSTMTGTLIVADSGLIEITMSGDRLDIQRFLEDEATDFQPAAKRTGGPISINAHFDEVLIAALPPITNAVMNLRDNGVRLADIQLNGQIGGEPISISYKVDDNAKHFEIRAEDAGRVLRGFEIQDSINGGQLVITGTTTGTGANEHTLIDLSVRDFGLTKAPVLAQVLNAAFLPALVDILRGNGIRFKRLTATIDVTKKRAKILDALAFGSSLGISASGEIDRVTKVIDINGMIVPAYGLSRLIDQIPILGEIITGGEKEGLLAAAYLIDGVLYKPTVTVTVNPLTALTPGFLRALVRATNDPDAVPPFNSGAGSDR